MENSSGEKVNDTCAKGVAPAWEKQDMFDRQTQITPMKTIHLFRLCSFAGLLLCAAGMLSCNDENEGKEAPKPFFLEKKSYEVMQKGSLQISVINGSGNIKLSTDLPEVIHATYTPAEAQTDPTLGTIRIGGVSKGEATLTVTDKTTKESETLQVKVTDTYMVYTLDHSNHPALTPSVIVYLVADKARTCYFFPYNPESREVTDALVAKGTYEFSVGKKEESKIPYLTLTYASDEKGRFTDAAIVPTAHTFDLSHSEKMAYYALESYLNFSWDALSAQAASKSSPIPLLTLTLQEVDTEYQIQGLLDVFPPIPENTLE